MAETPDRGTLIGTGEFLSPGIRSTDKTAVTPADPNARSPQETIDVSTIETGLEFDDSPSPEETVAETRRTAFGTTHIPEPGETDPIRSRLTPSAVPVFEIDPAKITADFATRQMADIEKHRAIGSYRTALQIGESFYGTTYREEFSMPLYRFLSEISARMCMLLDPVRNEEEIDKWTNRLSKLLDRLTANKGDNFEITHYTVALYLIRDFFTLCRCYLEKVKNPDQDVKWGGRSFEIGQWDYFSNRLKDMTTTQHAAPKTANDFVLRQRIDRLLHQLKNMVTRMRAVYTADMDRWDSSTLMRDRDSAVRTKLCSPSIVVALKGNTSRQGAVSIMTNHINSFTEAEKRFSPLVLSARVTQIRYLVDTGEYHKAYQEAEKLFPELERNGEQALVAQLHGIIGYGLFVLADLLLRHKNMGEILVHISAEAKKFTNSVNLREIVTNIINRGEDHLRVGLGIASRGSVKTPARGTTFRKEDFQKTAAQLRNQLLFGYSLKLQAGLPIAKSQEDDSLINIFQRAVYDLDQITNQEELHFVYAPRLAVIICHLRQLYPDIFDKEPMSSLLQRVKNICVHSLQFFEKERLVSFNPATFERVRQQQISIVTQGRVRTAVQEVLSEVELTENLDTPYQEVPWTDVTANELRTKSTRSGVPSQYFRILDEKRWYVRRLVRQNHKSPFPIAA